MLIVRDIQGRADDSTRLDHSNAAGGGFLTFFVLEQYLHWHHCHRSLMRHGPLGYLIPRGRRHAQLHRWSGRRAAFLVDFRVGMVAWIAAAMHEIPQELGDFGILVHARWSKRRALLFNLLSALTFLVGGLLAYTLAGQLRVAWLLPYAAGNFIYISAADLIPELTEHPEGGHKALLTTTLTVGLGLLLLVAAVV